MQRERVAVTSHDKPSWFDRHWGKLTLAAIVAVFFVYPLINEGESSECGATGQLFLRQTQVITSDGTNIATIIQATPFFEIARDEMVAEKVKQALPALPPFLGCNLIYWMRLFSPSRTPPVAAQQTPTE